MVVHQARKWMQVKSGDPVSRRVMGEGSRIIPAFLAMEFEYLYSHFTAALEVFAVHELRSMPYTLQFFFSFLLEIASKRVTLHC